MRTISLKIKKQDFLPEIRFLLGLWICWNYPIPSFCNAARRSCRGFEAEVPDDEPVEAVCVAGVVVVVTEASALVVMVVFDPSVPVSVTAPEEDVVVLALPLSTRLAKLSPPPPP